MMKEVELFSGSGVQRFELPQANLTGIYVPQAVEAVRRILQRALEDGLLLYPCGHWTQTIRLIPPLTVTREQVDEGLAILARAVRAEMA